MNEIKQNTPFPHPRQSSNSPIATQQNLPLGEKSFSLLVENVCPKAWDVYSKSWDVCFKTWDVRFKTWDINYCRDIETFSSGGSDYYLARKQNYPDVNVNS